MAEGKVTTMKLTINLQCCKCIDKVRKVLCKFPQIRDQVFDEKKGIVTIKVVCCDPEKLRDKLCCKGGGCIKSIEIVEKPPKPTPTPPPPENIKTCPKPAGICCESSCEGHGRRPICYQGCGMPPICYQVCVRPPICYDWSYGWPAYGSYCGSRPCCGSRRDECLCEENPQGCTLT